MGCPGNYCDRLSIAYPVLKANPCFSCHPERSEGSGEPDEEILRCAQDDSQETSPSPLHDFPGLCFCVILSLQLNS